MRIRVIIAIGATLVCTAASSAAPATADWSQATEIDVTLSNYAIRPHHLDLQHGQVYRLHVVNNGPSRHDFSAPDFFAAAQLDPADAASVKGGEVELKRGEAADLRLIPGAGTFKFKCTRFMHSMFGMHGTITVD